MRWRGEVRQRAAPELCETEEGALVRRVAARDRDAFDLLYRKYQWRLTRFIGQLTHRKHLIEEILDDTMMVVWHKAGSYNGQSRVSTWIFAIAYREVMRANERDSRGLRLPPSDGSSSVPSVESDVIEGESHSRLRHLVAQLSIEQRTVIELTYFHGFDYKEIAAAIGCPLNTVKTRMFHARRRLRALLVADAQE